MPALFALLLLALIGSIPLPREARAQTVSTSAPARLALVVGAGAYRNVGALPNTVRDAVLIAETVDAAGFEVMLVLNPDGDLLREALTEFIERLQREDTVGLAYFAGHGVQVDGANYLLPIDAEPGLHNVTTQGVNLDELLSLMAERRESGRLNIVILDACRENVFGTSGLANVRQKLPKGASFFIAYSTSPGDVATDGIAGQNGPYARWLAETIRKPWLPIDTVFNEVHSAVSNESMSAQLPWHARSFSGTFYFSSGSELSFWDRIQGSKRPEDFSDFLQQFPNGRFARNACIMAKDFGRADKESRTPPPGVESCPAGTSGRATTELVPESSIAPIPPERLQSLTCEELWIARNEIFRRHGYCFRGERGLNYFGNSGCTTPHDDILTRDPQYATALRNVHMIRSAASAKFCAGQ